MFGSILQRMILWELTKVFVMSLVGITGILLMAGIIAEASQQGLGPTQILAAIPLLVPSTLPYTIPATTLFATCVVYGRLAADNELLAIKSAGINAVKVVRPGIVLGLVMSSVTMGLYYRIIPYTHHLLRAMVYNDAEELLYSLLKKHNAISHSSFPYQMFVHGVRGKKLISPVFKHKDCAGRSITSPMPAKPSCKCSAPRGSCSSACARASSAAKTTTCAATSRTKISSWTCRGTSASRTSDAHAI